MTVEKSTDESEDVSSGERESNEKNGRSATSRRRLLQLTGVAAVGTVVGSGDGAADHGPDPAYGTEESPKELLEQMTLDEKVHMVHGHDYELNPADEPITGYIPPIPRLDIPDLKMSDGPVGVRHQTATAFPATIGLAGSWDPEYWQDFGTALSSESKAKDQDVILAPGFNIGRVPECGRNFEYFGEDPYLASRTAVHTVESIQDNGTIATVKHYVANNQEVNRMTVSADVADRPLREIYLPAFEAAVTEAEVGAVMIAYNRVNGTYATENKRLITDILKEEWGFDGYTISDWTATKSTVPAAKAGLDVEMPYGVFFGDALKEAVQSGEVNEATLDDKVLRVLGQMDRFSVLKGDRVGPDGAANTDEHQRLAREIATEGAVLLKNEEPDLPIDLDDVDTIAVIGHNADEAKVGGGGSSDVTPPYSVSPLEGIRERAGDDAEVTFTRGHVIADAVAAAQEADVAVVVAEGSSSEQMDREDLKLNDGQNELIASVAEANEHTAVVLNTGGPIVMPWLGDVPAILEMWYPGMEDGHATADVLFGDVDPGGRLPFTFAKERVDYPADPIEHPERYPGVNEHAEYSEGIYVGYRHFDERNVEPEFPFGHGESYTTFAYEGMAVSPDSVDPNEETVAVSIDVTNTGDRTGKEVVQLYVHDHFASVDRPVKELRAFEAVRLDPGETTTVEFELGPDALSFYDTYEDAWVSEAGRFTVLVGRSSRDIRLLDSFEATAGTRTSNRDPGQQPTTPFVSGEREDDGSVFTGGQTDHVELTIEATDEVTIRDQVPSEWSVVEGDAHEVYTEDDTKYIEFDAAVQDGTRTYFAEAPEGLESTNTYTFGPIEYTFDGESWRTLYGTTDDNTVAGVDTDL